MASIPQRLSFLRNKKFWDVVLGIIGFAIVFTAYVVKEDWRDYIRGQVSAIDAEQGRFVIATEVDASYPALIELDRKISDVDRYVRSRGAKGAEEPITPLSVRKATVAAAKRAYQLYQGAIARMCNVLPNRSPELMAEYTVLNAKVDAMGTKADEFMKLSGDKTGVSEESKLSWDFKEIAELTQKISVEVQLEADKEKAHLQDSYEHYRSITDVVYLIGFVVAIAGKCIGARDGTR